MASYGWGSKLQRPGLGGGVGEGLSHLYQQFSLRVPDYTAPALPLLPPPPADCSINQSNLLNVVFCLGMHVGKKKKKMHIFSPIRTISAAVETATALLDNYEMIVPLC